MSAWWGVVLFIVGFVVALFRSRSISNKSSQVIDVLNPKIESEKKTLTQAQKEADDALQEYYNSLDDLHGDNSGDGSGKPSQ